MKNKKNTFILLPIVLLIWGLVVYDFFSFSAPDNLLRKTATQYAIKPFKLKERDTFSINVAYRDPFLGKRNTPQTADSIKSNAKTKKRPKPVETIVWPAILYKGIVSDSKEKNKIFMLVIAGHNFFMKKGDTENGVFLKDGDKESVYVKYKGNLNLIMLAG